MIPYLFAVLGEYDEVQISQDILSSINRLFPWGYVGGEADLIELSGKFSGFAKQLVAGAYYYDGALTHSGSLCETLIEITAKSRHSKEKLPFADVPTLLSVWSGEKCPVFYGQDVDDRCVQDVLGYVSQLPGCSGRLERNISTGIWLSSLALKEGDLFAVRGQGCSPVCHI